MKWKYSVKVKSVLPNGILVKFLKSCRGNLSFILVHIHLLYEAQAKQNIKYLLKNLFITQNKVRIINTIQTPRPYRINTYICIIFLDMMWSVYNEVVYNKKKVV
jgi:hypothetical protein